MKTLAFVFGLFLMGTAWIPARADFSAADAVKAASDGVDPSLRNKIVSIYGVGVPTSIQTWWIIFFDSSVPSHGRAVKIENGTVTRSYEAKGGVTYADALTFSPSQVSGEHRALTASQDYAAKHALAYDQVRILLRVTTPGEAMRWRVQLRDEAKNRGFVFVNAQNGAFVMYSPPGAVTAKDASTTGGGGVIADAKNAANDVKSTFLGIGGDLQEFFTGDRTVDQ